MKKQTFILACIGAFVLSSALVAGFAYRRAENDRRALAERDQARFELLVRPDSRALGPVDAKVTVVEFFDPECESCRQVYPIVKEMLKPYGEQVRLVVRYMPFHQNSVYAASALEAAGEQGRYWELLEAMFRRQPEWADHHSPKPEMIPGFARDLGLDMRKFEASLRDEKHRAKVLRDKTDGEALGVRGTPSFFVNGRELQQLGYEPLKALIDEELAKSPSS